MKYWLSPLGKGCHAQFAGLLARCRHRNYDVPMGNVINLRQARKARQRTDKAREAEANRAKFGRTKAQKAADAAEEQKKTSRLDGAYREDRSNMDDE
jgi:hypothetical protein